MATVSFKKNLIIKDEKTLKRLEKAIDNPKKLNSKKIDWEQESKKEKKALKLLQSLSEK